MMRCIQVCIQTVPECITATPIQREENLMRAVLIANLVLSFSGSAMAQDDQKIERMTIGAMETFTLENLSGLMSLSA